MRYLVLLCVLLCAPATASAGFIPCPSTIPLYKQVRESNDERVSAIFADVIKRTGMTDKRFALCESDEFMPGIFPVFGTDEFTFALVLPKAISGFSDTVVAGLIAHEIAHTKRMELNGGKTVELMADMQAAAWVGTESVIAALRSMEKNIWRFPKWQQDLGRHSLRYRLNALIYGLYEVY